MKNILFIVTKSENGGAQKWVKEQIDILKGMYNIFIVTDKQGWLIKNTEVTGHFTHMGIRNKLSLKFLTCFSSYLKKNNIDLIIASSANAGLYSRLSKFFHRSKVVYVGHGWSSIYNGGRLKFIFTRIEKYLSFMTESILCVSESDFSRAINEIGIHEKKLKLIKNKIMPMTKRPESSHEDIKILTVSRFRKPKRNDLLIESMQQVEASLYLVGGGPDKEPLQKKASNKIHFLGEVDSFGAFNKYDIFVLISDSEGLPLSVIEAMSAGLPLVLSNVGGCPELIDNNGVLVENEPSAIAEGINEVISNRDRYARRSLEIFDKEFNLLKSKDIYLEYYNEVLVK